MENCLKNLSRDEIFMEVGKDDMDKCNECQNLIYKNGTMTCSLIENSQEG